MTLIPKTSGCVKGFARRQRCFGRAGLPAAWLNQLYADYQELGSLELVGLKHGRSRQSVYQIFKRAGLKRNPRPGCAAHCRNVARCVQHHRSGRASGQCQPDRLWLSDWRRRGWIETVGTREYQKTANFGKV